MVGRAIDSILAQETDAEMEIVIGDDCSTDNVRQVLLRYKDKYPNIIHLIFHKQNLGLGANWASCVKECRGKYICNCDNDDYWHNPHKLQLQLDYMESHPQSNVCITDHRHYNCQTGEIIEKTAYIDHNNIQQSVWGGAHFGNITMMYRADFIKAHLDLDEWIKRRFTLQDWPAWVILSAYTDFDIIHVSTGTVCIETKSITRPDSVDNLAKRYEGDKEVCRYLGELFPDKFPFNEEDWNNYVNGRLLSKAYDLTDYKNAQKYSELYHDGTSKIKIYGAKNKWLFMLICKLRKIRKKLS